jgi:uncharacterized protein with GYD domain
MRDSESARIDDLGGNMATYVVLANWTQQARQGVGEGRQRRAAARAVAESLGAEIKQVYLTMGRYDLVIIIEAPNDETVAKIALKVGATGNLTTETLRAFNEGETDQLLASL